MDYRQKTEGQENPGRRDGRVCNPQDRSSGVFDSKDGAARAKSEKGSEKGYALFRAGNAADLKPLQAIKLAVDRGIELIDVAHEPN